MTNWLTGLRGKGDAGTDTKTDAGGGRHWLIGASHVGALRRALQDGAGGAGITMVALGDSRVSKAPFHSRTAQGLRFSDARYQSAFETMGLAAGLAPGDRVGVLLGDANTVLLDHAGYWTTHEPAALCQAGRAPVPETTLQAICDAQTAPVRVFVADLVALGMRPYWVPYPPIKQDHPMFALGVRPDVIRALDAMFLTRMQEAMTALGVPSVPRPAAAITDTGLLKPAYSQATTGSGAADWVHANAAWGALMLEAVATRIAA